MVSQKKLSGRILTLLNQSMRQDFSDPRLAHVVITKVELNRNGSVAHVFWDSSQQKGPAQKAMACGLGRMRSSLAAVLKTKKVPQLVLHNDREFEATQQIEKLISLGRGRP